MENNKGITVLMPTYNCIEYVDSAILSILSQTRKQFKLLAYDDYSSDGTYERLQFWSSVDPRVVSRRPFNKNEGYIELLNQMLSDAKTHYVARQDADDISMPRRFEFQFDFMNSSPRAVLCGTQGVNIIEDEGGHIVRDYPWESQIVNPIASYSDPANALIREHHRFIHGSMLAVREAVKKVGGYDTTLAPVEDWYLSLKLSEVGDVFVLPELGYVRRIHSRNVSRGHPNKPSAIRKIVDRFGLPKDKDYKTRPKHL
jgi:glycosyltransferase involved in cell wall biosynthesis